MRARVTQAIAWRSGPRNSATAAGGVLSVNRRQHGDVAHSGIGVGILERAGPPLPQEVRLTHPKVAARGAIKKALLGGAAEPADATSRAGRRRCLRLLP